MKKELIEIIEKYKKEWDKYGMGASISYSSIFSDLEALLKAKEEQGDSIVFHPEYQKLVDQTHKKATEWANKQSYSIREVNALEWIVERIESEKELDLKGDGEGLYEPIKSLYDKITDFTKEEQPKDVKGFLKACEEVRKDFAETISTYPIEYNKVLRTKTDTLLIMYDQLTDFANSNE